MVNKSFDFIRRYRLPARNKQRSNSSQALIIVAFVQNGARTRSAPEEAENVALMAQMPGAARRIGRSLDQVQE